MLRIGGIAHESPTITNIKLLLQTNDLYVVGLTAMPTLIVFTMPTLKTPLSFIVPLLPSWFQLLVNRPRLQHWLIFLDCDRHSSFLKMALQSEWE